MSPVFTEETGTSGTDRSFDVNGLLYLFLLALGIVSSGCAIFSKSIPPVNLQEPGWSVRQGQAVWKLPTKGEHEIAGDVLLATTTNGRALVQFSKTPFTLLIGQISGNHWQVELPPQNKRYAGPGAPPKRLLWLYLPRALEGKPLPHGWHWTNSGPNWRLENTKSGETIEGFFNE